jgi:hypothetical protein
VIIQRNATIALNLDLHRSALKAARSADLEQIREIAGENE